MEPGLVRCQYDALVGPSAQVYVGDDYPDERIWEQWRRPFAVRPK
jgi:hypothetical protein